MQTDDRNDLPEVDASEDLQVILARYPLPPGVPDADLNQSELATAMNTTVNTVGKWIGKTVLSGDWSADRGDQFPAVEIGGPGRPYVLRLSHAFAWRQNRDAQEQTKNRKNREAIEKMQASFLGLDVDDGAAVLDPTTRRKLAEADILHSKAAQLRRQLVRLDELTEMLERVMRIVRDGIEGMPDRLERELGLKPEEVALVARVGDDILTGIAQEIEDAELRERDLADVEIGEGLVFS